VIGQFNSIRIVIASFISLFIIDIILDIFVVVFIIFQRIMGAVLLTTEEPFISEIDAPSKGKCY
jgi:hypothetical protein